MNYTNNRGYAYPSDASYVRLKDVTLSYSLPAPLVEKLKLGSVSAYVSGRNIYTWTKWIGWDPEQTYTSEIAQVANGNGNFPTVASYVFGLSLGLR